MNAAIHQSTIAALWPRVRALFDRFIAVFGAPAALAILEFSSSDARRVIVRQLTRVEMYVRKLLLAEAMLLTQAKQRGPRLIAVPLCANGLYTSFNQTEREVGFTRGSNVDRARPETWSVTFAFALPRDTHTVPETIAPRVRTLWGKAAQQPAASPPTPSQRRPAALRIARRVEALRRVLNDPTPHARRLAHAYRASSARNPTTLARYAFTTPRHLCVGRQDPQLDVDIHRASWIARDVGDAS